MSVKEKILNRLGLLTKKSHSREVKRSVDRAFKAAKASIKQQDWPIRRNEISLDTRFDLIGLRARGYDMRINNPIVSSIIYDKKYNVIGSRGFDFQPMAQFGDGTQDDVANRILKGKFDEWSHRNYCMVNKRYSFLMLQYLLVDQMFIDGEIILRKYYSGEAVKDNPFGFTVDFVDPNDIDHLYNAQYPNGSQTVMGVQVDKLRRLEGIWVRQKSIFDEATIGIYNYGFPRYFLSVDELIFAFDPMHYKQIHGITPLANSMLSIKDLDMWVDYSLQNAKSSAAKTGFLQKSETTIEQYTGSMDTDNQTEMIDDLGGKYMDFAPGTVEELPSGYTFQGYDPKFPHEQHDKFVRSIGRMAISALGRDYTSVMGDRENESYSSGKTGELKNLNADAYEQSIIREQILIPLYESWLKYALLNGALEPLNKALEFKYRQHDWQGNRRPWLDMLKEMQAFKLAESMGYISKKQIITQSGGRLEDQFRDRQEYLKLVKKYKFELELPVVSPAGSAAVEPDDVTDKTPATNLSLIAMEK